jgi:hypothetical protein
LDDRSRRQLQLIRRLASDAPRSVSELRPIVTNLRALIDELDEASSEWRSEASSHWAVLEEIYAYKLAVWEGIVHDAEPWLSERDHVLIAQALASLVDLVDRWE